MAKSGHSSFPLSPLLLSFVRTTLSFFAGRFDSWLLVTGRCSAKPQAPGRRPRIGSSSLIRHSSFGLRTCASDARCACLTGLGGSIPVSGLRRPAGRLDTESTEARLGPVRPHSDT